MRSADDELAGGVHVIGDVVVEESQDVPVGDGFLHAGNENVDDIVAYLLLHGFVAGKLVVLGAYHDGVYAHGYVFVAVFDGNLALGVGTQVGHHLALAAYVGQHAQQAVAQVQAQGHVVLCLVGGIAEHHALVAGTLVLALLALHTTVDVAALLVYGAEHSAGVAIEHVLALGVTDTVDDFACNALQVNVCLSLDFAGQNHLTCSYESLASHF